MPLSALSKMSLRELIADDRREYTDQHRRLRGLRNNLLKMNECIYFGTPNLY